jgi:hypothetical protein
VRSTEVGNLSCLEDSLGKRQRDSCDLASQVGKFVALMEQSGSHPEAVTFPLDCDVAIEITRHQPLDSSGPSVVLRPLMCSNRCSETWSWNTLAPGVSCCTISRVHVMELAIGNSNERSNGEASLNNLVRNQRCSKVHLVEIISSMPRHVQLELPLVRHPYFARCLHTTHPPFVCPTISSTTDGSPTDRHADHQVHTSDNDYRHGSLRKSHRPKANCSRRPLNAAAMATPKRRKLETAGGAQRKSPPGARQRGATDPRCFLRPCD